jgi:hypothetical protein
VEYKVTICGDETIAPTTSNNLYPMTHSSVGGTDTTITLSDFVTNFVVTHPNSWTECVVDTWEVFDDAGLTTASVSGTPLTIGSPTFSMVFHAAAAGKNTYYVKATTIGGATANAIYEATVCGSETVTNIDT